MKIQVVHQTGAIETLSLQSGAWTLEEGRTLDRLRDGSIEHFFTKDGYYDGWGGGVHATPTEAAEVLSAMEEKREILPADHAPAGRT